MDTVSEVEEQPKRRYLSYPNEGRGYGMHAHGGHTSVDAPAAVVQGKAAGRKLIQVLFENGQRVFDGRNFVQRKRDVYNPRRCVDHAPGALGWLEQRHGATGASEQLLLPGLRGTSRAEALTTRFMHMAINKSAKSRMQCVAWQPDGSRIVVGTENGELLAWHSRNFSFESLVRGHQPGSASSSSSLSGVSALKYTTGGHAGAGGHLLLSADRHGVVKYWHASLSNVMAFQAHSEAISDLAVSPCDTAFASCSDDKSVRIWDLATGDELCCFVRHSATTNLPPTLEAHTWYVRSVDWHPVHSLVASAGSDRSVRFWDIRQKTHVHTLQGYREAPSCVRFNPHVGRGDHLLAMGGKESVLRIIDLRTMRELAECATANGAESARVTWSTCADTWDTLVCGDREGELSFFQAEGVRDAKRRVSTSAQKSASPTASAQTAILEPAAVVRGAHFGGVTDVAFSPLSHLLVSTSVDCTAKFWSRPLPEDALNDQHNVDSLPPLERAIGMYDLWRSHHKRQVEAPSVATRRLPVVLTGKSEEELALAAALAEKQKEQRRQQRRQKQRKTLPQHEEEDLFATEETLEVPSLGVADRMQDRVESPMPMEEDDELLSFASSEASSPKADTPSDTPPNDLVRAQNDRVRDTVRPDDFRSSIPADLMP